MFFIFGTKYKKEAVWNGVIVEKFCLKCKQNRKLVEFLGKKYFSLFFIPIIPLGAEENFLHCVVCGTDYYLNTNDLESAKQEKILLEIANKVLINCIKCKKQIRINKFEKDSIDVKCPYCQCVFTLKKQWR